MEQAWHDPALEGGMNGDGANSDEMNGGEMNGGGMNGDGETEEASAPSSFLLSAGTSAAVPHLTTSAPSSLLSAASSAAASHLTDADREHERSAPPLKGLASLRAAVAQQSRVIAPMAPGESIRTPSSVLALPAEPMAPIYDEQLPQGADWCYQLKWDGVRILARIGSDRQVEFYSRSMFLKNAIYPEIVQLLEQRAEALGPCLLDGEVVWWNGVRPNFQMVLKRERSRGSSIAAIGSSNGDGDARSGTGSGGGLVYVLFDLLADGGEDLRQQPYAERYRQLSGKFSEKDSQMFVTDTFHDGEALWKWVEANQWEGVVSKRLSSTYQEGKKHRDWLKKKTAILLDVDIVGLKWRSGMIVSLVMAYEGNYLGSVSSGLNEALRKVLMSTFRPGAKPVPALPCPFSAMPEDLKREDVQWLHLPFRCRVTGLELTSAGQLRHPKLVTFLPKDPLA